MTQTSVNVWRQRVFRFLWRQNQTDKMAAALERSMMEVCGFERESVQRFKDVSVDMGKEVVAIHIPLSLTYCRHLT